MQKKIVFWVDFIFLRKKNVFSGRFSAFYGQRSVTAAWPTRSPWSIDSNFSQSQRSLNICRSGQEIELI